MFLLFLVFASLLTSNCFASTLVLDQPNLKASKDVFLKNLKQSTLKKQVNQSENSEEQASKHSWAMSIAKSLPLKKDCRMEGDKKIAFYNHSQSVGFGYNYEKLGAFFTANGYRYRQPWDPDFTLAFGYYDWEPGGVCFEFRNDGGNRFRPKNKERVIDHDSSSWSLSYRLPIADAVQKAFKYEAENPFGISIGYSVTSKYFDLKTSTKKRLKQKVSIGLSYQITQSLSIGTGFGIFLKHSKQPWDSEYTYNMSYNIPLPRGQLNITYANYGPTRFPLSRKIENTSSKFAFDSGSITLSWSCKLHDLFKGSES